jgi:hypothetical protein
MSTDKAENRKKKIPRRAFVSTGGDRDKGHDRTHGDDEHVLKHSELAVVKKFISHSPWFHLKIKIQIQKKLQKTTKKQNSFFTYSHGSTCIDIFFFILERQSPSMCPIEKHYM